MDNFLKFLRSKPHMAIGLPAVLGAITFVTNLVSALTDGVIDSNELHTLMSTIDGFETVLLFVVMGVLKDKNK